MSSAPWIKESELNITDTRARLHNEILALEKYLEPTSREILDRDELFLDVKYLVSGLWPGKIDTVPFGPTETGLLLPASDVEVNLEYIDKSFQISKSDIYRAMLEKGVCDHIFYMEDTFTRMAAKLLTIKKPTGILAKISVDRDMTDYKRTLTWKREYPELKPLYLTIYLVIHHCRPFKKLDYNPMGAESNKLPDYGLICLIVNYLRHEKPSDILPEHNLATLLLGFFRFYSNLDADETAISLRDNDSGYLKPSDMPFDTPQNKGKLVILDPDKDRNVAKSCTCFAYLKNVMMEVADILEESLDQEDNCNSILSSIIKIEPHDYNKSRKQGIEFKLENLIINIEVKKKGKKKSKSAKSNSEGSPVDSIKEEEYTESSDDDELYTSAKYESIESFKTEHIEPSENGFIASNQNESGSKLMGKRKIDDIDIKYDENENEKEEMEMDDDDHGDSKNVNGKDHVMGCKYSAEESIDDAKGENLNIKLEHDSSIREEQGDEDSLNGDGNNNLDDSNQPNTAKLSKAQRKKRNRRARKRRRKEEEEAQNASDVKIETKEGDQNNENGAGAEARAGAGNENRTQVKTRKRPRHRHARKKAKKAALLA